MRATGKYVCAFRGRRDYYQAPLALAEAGLLDQFITDAYFVPKLRRWARLFPRRWLETLRSRYEPRLPDGHVKCLWWTTAVEQSRYRLGFSPAYTFAKFDGKLSRAAEARARATQSNLFLYSPYAWEAITAAYDHAPRKVLFQYHPHPDVERRILLEDAAKYPFLLKSTEADVGEYMSDDLKRRNRDSWRHADLIMCASTFTKQSLVEAGADPGLCRIVPYGIDVARAENVPMAPRSFRPLFVGTGSQRKGLHHLLLAWRKAALPGGSQLTLVCRSINLDLAKLARQTPNVRLIAGIGADDLARLYRTSSLLVMPSLLEGFGQVYLEALAQGCPVLGTANTCLPDLGPSASIFQIVPGDIDELVASLERLARLLPGHGSFRSEACECAARWPWDRFRNGLRSALEAIN